MSQYRIILLIFISFFATTQCFQAQVCDIYYNDVNEENQSSILKSKDIPQLLDSLNQIGFYTVQLDSVKTEPCQAYITKGKQFRKIFVEITKAFDKSTLPLHYQKNLAYTNNLDSLLVAIKANLAQEGKPFAKISVEPKGYFETNAIVKIQIDSKDPRHIDNIKFIGYDKAPSFLKRQLLKNNYIYNDTSLEKIQAKISSYTFVQQTQPSRVSFSNDSTTLYIYLEKVQRNTFDGIIGFETDDKNHLNLQGNVEINLRNVFNRNEAIYLNWESGREKSQQLHFRTRLPYLFQTNFGLQTSLNLFKQDSTFIKFGMNNELEYYLNPNHAIGGHYSFTTSNYIDDDTKDFNKNAWGLSYRYTRNRYNKLQVNKTQVLLRSSIWNKSSEQQSEDETQTEITFDISQQQRIWKNHFAFLKLKGENLLYDGPKSINDMYMVGGYNSLRGYNQNSIFTSSYNFGTIAYRFIPNEKILFEFFTDLGFFELAEEDNYEFLQSYGVGMNFKTGFGLFKLSYALPTQVDTNSLSNGKVHIGITNYF